MGHTYYTRKFCEELQGNLPLLSQRETEQVVSTMLSLITAKVEAGHKVAFTGFGTFLMRDQAARQGRNPATGAPVAIPAKRVLVFKPAKGKTDDAE